MSSTRAISTLSFSFLLASLTFWLGGCGSNVPDVVESDETGFFPTINIDNSDLKEYDDLVYLGIGESFDIRWTVSQAPAGSTIHLYLDEDGSSFTDEDQIEITPEGGVDTAASPFEFVPSVESFQLYTGRTYFVYAELYGPQGYVASQTMTKGRIRIGEGGLKITAPVADTTIPMGQEVTVSWETTGDICSRRLDKKKILRLYIDELPMYRPEQSIQVTDANGINMCEDATEFSFQSDRFMKAETSYYLIARMFLEGNFEEESRAVSDATVTVAGVRLNVLRPSENISSNLQTVYVAWELVNIDPSGRLVKIFAVPFDLEDPNSAGSSEAMALASGLRASAGTAMVDMSKLPPGTYKVRIRLYEINSASAEVTRGSGDSTGTVTVPDGYAGLYDLTDMSMAAQKQYSPIDGAVFKGFNINDQVGFEVAGVGDIDGDGRSEILLFARYGQEYTGGDAGSAYLIYGTDSFPYTFELNGVASPLATERELEGSVLLLPMENLAAMAGDTIFGTYYALSLPDVSGDNQGDIMLGCPEAAPLTIMWMNEHPTQGQKVEPDMYGLEWTIPAASGSRHPIHVHPQMTIRGQCGPDFRRFNLQFGGIPNDMYYLPGDIIHCEWLAPNFCFNVWVEHVQERRGATYLLTSQRLAAYRNGIYDLNKIGSPVEDGVSDAPGENFGGTYIEHYTGSRERAEMLTGFDSEVRWGTNVSPIGDLDGDGNIEIIYTSPLYDMLDLADPDRPTRSQAGVGVVLGSEHRHRSLPFHVGTIAWMNPEWVWAHGEELNGTPVGTDGSKTGWKLDIMGAEAGSHVTGVAGLGAFAQTDSFGQQYVKNDFNDDQVPDVVLGAPGENNGAGSIYVLPLRPVSGRRVSIIDLADFNIEKPTYSDPDLEVPVLGIKLNGTVEGEALGERVKPAGDFDGDGLADVMWSIPSADASGRVSAGRVTIMFGVAGVIGDFTVDEVSSQLGTQLPGLIFEGQNNGDRFGTRICAVYDVNGDGLDDILAAAPYADGPGRDDCGKIYLIYGKRNIVKTDTTTGFKYVDYDGDGLPDDYWNVQEIGFELPGAVFVGEHAGDRLEAIAPAGDVNGDLIGDFLLGSPYSDISDVQQNAGKAYLILGR